MKPVHLVGRPRGWLACLTMGLLACPAETLLADAPTTRRVQALPAFQRPIRIPQRVPLLQADPPYALANQWSTWRLHFELANDVPAGKTLRLELSGKRNNHGVFRAAQVNRPDAPGYVTARLDSGEPIKLSKGNNPATFTLAVPQTGFAKAAKIVVTLGDTAAGGTGILAPDVRQLNKFFVLYCPDLIAKQAKETIAFGSGWGEAQQKRIVGACVMHILGRSLDHLRAYVPSQCSPGQTLTVLVRPQDSLGNLSCNYLGDVQVFLGDRRLDATSTPVENSTCVNATVTLPTEGTHRLKVVDRRSGKSCLTNPTDCRATPDKYKVCWGMMHGHTELSDGCGTLEYYFRQMRDEAALDFAASSDHDHLWEAPDSYWRLTCDTVKRFNEPGRFVTILGYEWAKWRRNGDGDRNVYYLKDDQPRYRSDDGHYPRPTDLFRALADKQALVIPHHPACFGNFCDWKDHDPQPERLVEIHQVRGCYECPIPMGNPLPPREPNKDQHPVEKGFVSNALAQGWRVGFTAGGDDHRGTAGTDRPAGTFDGKVYYAGQMGVLATAKTREAIWDGLRNRRVVATSGPRVLLRFEIDGHVIGSELTLADHPELAGARTLHVRFCGTAPIKRIDVIRNNEVAHSTTDGEFEWKDTTPLAKLLLPAGKWQSRPFCFYYIRVIQTDGQAAWASPIWIDG